MPVCHTAQPFAVDFIEEIKGEAMGKGIDLARDAGAGLHADVLDDFKDQLLIVFLKRLKEKYGDDITFPVAETDDTGQDLCAFKIVDGKFIFVLEKKP